MDPAASSSLSVQVTLTGLLPFVVLVASVLSLPCSLGLLALYRRSVLRGMREAGAAASSPQAPAPASPPAQRLSIALLDALSGDAGSTEGTLAFQNARRAPQRTALLYAFAGAVYAAIMTAGWLLATRDESRVWIKVLLLWWTYFWPAVLTALLVAADDRRRRLQLLCGYFAALTALVAIAVARNPGMGIGELPLYWLIENAAPTVLLLTFLLRPIRAVGPLVLAFLIAATVGSQALLIVVSADMEMLRPLAEAGFRMGLGGTGVFVGMILAGALLFAVLAWPALRWLGHRYERKRFSEQSVTIDSLWLLFAVVQSIGLAFEGGAWILTGPLAFLAYKVVAAASLRAAASSSRTTQPRTLLLLRVFALGSRSEQLFTRLRRRWQYIGSIGMIAGPDLVTTTVEPHEFLEFLSGRLGRQFVADADDLEQRLQRMDGAPDPDGRYRINEFFCRSNTWQMTMERLATSSHAVLMDLRSFSPSNQGCVYELGRLIDTVDLTRVLFLVDDTTDRKFLETTLFGLWQHMIATSPNRAASAPAARMFHIRHGSRQELLGLLRWLL
jgi:hypothetical protein